MLAIFTGVAPSIAAAVVCFAVIMRLLLSSDWNVMRVVGWRLHATNTTVPAGQTFTHR